MANKKTLSGNLAIRINKEDLDNFKTKSASFDKPYRDMIIEMITAFNNDRLRIIPTDEQKASLIIYQE